ncbi:MAG: ABC transporter ATP-binding protein [Sulfobacillus benefaciens]|uniref:ABC transporter ATP-binding protein n=1 Tax=Sulfobacillus benefaciens TaxID=453960 RepID=A0A2T2XIV2_9FIRM|nr:MAG: ABC transporter ATP-binding protein [Sulfobacillus benefaciens]
MASIAVDHVWKQFVLKKDRADSVGHLMLRMIPQPRNKRPKSEPFWALRDISIDMPHGTSFGIVGNNGSGKSTLLKILTQTMKPTRGSIAVSGRVSALIELGAGFHPDFTGRENVYLNGSILGIGRKAIDAKMEEIIEFADIRPFIDTSVKYYSSGMQARLGFAVATSVDPEILIVDEVLAVGDEAFQQRCMDRIFTMKRSGTNILLVSHDLGSIERLMDRAVWINRGEMQIIGNPRDVVFAYRQSMIDQNAGFSAQEDVRETTNQTTFMVNEAYIETGSRRVDSIQSGDTMVIVTLLDNQTGVEMEGHFSYTIRRPDGLEIVSLSSMLDGAPMRFAPGPGQIRVQLPELYLTSGQYEVDAAVYDQNGRRIAEWRALIRFAVQAMQKTPGLLVLPHQWQIK